MVQRRPKYTVGDNCLDANDKKYLLMCHQEDSQEYQIVLFDYSLELSLEQFLDMSWQSCKNYFFVESSASFNKNSPHL